MRRCGPLIPARRRGFTLVEAIATMVIISVLGSAASMVIARAAGMYAAAATTGQLQAELSAAMDRLEREVRAIRPKAGTPGAADLSGATASGLSWTAAGGACAISWSGGQLLLAKDGGAAAAILTDVSALSVQCYDESGVALAPTLSAEACEALRRISITATLTRHGSTAMLRSGIYLRSTMTGAGS
jgi:prepilin-type N-terminal cleavage/methylation domain-containing protein